MSAKRASTATFVEHAWKVILNQMEKGILRGGKTLARQAQFSLLRVKDGKIHTRLSSKGFDGGTYSIELPCVDNWEVYTDNLAYWFAHRLDWLAATLSGEWNDEFLIFIEQAGLRIFPDQTFSKQLLNEAKCTCHSLDPICKHMIGMIYKMIWEMEVSPLRAIEFTCVKPKILMDKIHVLSCEWVKENDILSSERPSKKKQVDLHSIRMWGSEQAVFTHIEHSDSWINIRQNIPKFNTNEIKRRRDIYMAWE